MNATNKYIVSLGEISAADVQRAGAKAANLGELARAGFPVPPGIVLTTDAFRRFLAANGLGPDSPAEAVTAAHFPPDLARAFSAAAQPLNGTPMAVRSSAVAEDLAGASFAGQYETVLDVRGEEDLREAALRCWASAFSKRVAGYRAVHGQAGDDGMALLIQHLVHAEAAGVAFTANPVTGERTETVISAVRGLGERLVSGQATPDEWVVWGDEAICRTAPEGAIDAGQARTIARMARQAETHFGCPQDVEWAIEDGRLYMLQARPITTLAESAVEQIPIPIEVPSGFWESDAEHMPKPLSRLTASIVLQQYSRGTAMMCANSGLLLERVEYRSIGGWMYMRLVPLGGKDMPAPPKPLMWLLVRTVPAMRARIARGKTFVRHDEASQMIERWYHEWYPEMEQEIAAVRDVDLPALSDEALAVHVARAIALMARGNEYHFRLAGLNPFAMYELITACGELLSWDEPGAMRLLAGLSRKSTEPSRRLAELATRAASSPELRRLLEHPAALTEEKLAAVDPEFAAAFAAYQHAYGCRGFAFDLMEPTIAETPALVLGWIRDLVSTCYDPEADAAQLAQERAQAVKSARNALAERPAAERARFELALAHAERAYPTQEDNVFFTQNVPTGLARYALLELGRRLAQRGIIERRDDVFFLELPEAEQAFAGGGDLKALVRRRQGERAWALAHPGPATYGRPPGPPPSLDVLPEEERFLMSVVPWCLERAVAGGRGRRQAAAESLSGVPASSGTYRGPVRVIRSEQQFHKLQPGDVLVCPATTPAWSVLFANVGALVTDTGGILSHPAIIAREYRVPAVVATGNATTLLHDGQIVTVDGSSGRVELAAAS